MTGSSVFDYVHQQDHAEVAEQLGLGLASNSTSGPHSSSSGLASPSSAASEEHGSSSTANPDGKISAAMFLFFLFSNVASHIVRVEIAKLINFELARLKDTFVCSLFERGFIVLSRKYSFRSVSRFYLFRLIFYSFLEGHRRDL